MSENQSKIVMKIPVQVHPIVREFIIDTTGSDVIKPNKDSLFWKTIKFNLDLPPKDYHEPKTIDNIVYVALMNCSGSKSVNKHTNNLLHIDTIFRWYLSEESQREISKHLHREFKHAYHCFMQGAITVNPNLEQYRAMDEFCNLYHLTLNELSEDMLKKSWDRSAHKKMIAKKNSTFCPLFY